MVRSGSAIVATCSLAVSFLTAFPLLSLSSFPPLTPPGSRLVGHQMVWLPKE